MLILNSGSFCLNRSASIQCIRFLLWLRGLCFSGFWLFGREGRGPAAAAEHPAALCLVRWQQGLAAAPGFGGGAGVGDAARTFQKERQEQNF